MVFVRRGVSSLAAAATMALALLATLSLGGCSGGLGAPALGGTEIRENRHSSNGDIELILDPVDVWDSKGAGQYFTETLDGDEFHFRQREKGTFDQAWVRIGLFAHSRRDRIYVPVAVLGPPVKVKRIQFVLDTGSSIPRLAKDFSFEPEKRAFDRDLSSASFEIKPEFLQKLAASKDARIIVETNRGSLGADLSVVTGRKKGDLLLSVKYRLKEFSDRYAAMLAEKS